MNSLQRIVVISGAISCIVACVGDLLFTFILGSRYTGYNQLSDVISFLGSSKSPYSDIISLWWIILGALILMFATGLRTAFVSGDKYLNISFWLLVIYGLGEGMGSGLFKADFINNSPSTSFIIHEILGGAGVFAILILPLTVQKIVPLSESILFRRFSLVIIISGMFFFILFTLRYIGLAGNFSFKFTGLWQRLFIFNYYVYLIVIAFIMIKRATGH